MAVNIDDYTFEDDYGDHVVSKSDAISYAQQVAKEALTTYINQQKTTNKTNEKGAKMAGKNVIADVFENVKEGAGEAAKNILTESETSTALITGEILLENIETLADKLILKNLNWWQRLTITKQNKELAVTIGTYAIVHAIKTGGFGLTKYRINHTVLDFITLAANQKLLKAVVKATGVNTNVAALLLSVPTITKEEE